MVNKLNKLRYGEETVIEQKNMQEYQVPTEKQN